MPQYFDFLTTAFPAPPVWAFPGAQTGTSTWAPLRTPNVFKTISGVGVSTGVPISGWVPAAGKKFRLMAYHLSLQASGAIILKDGLVGEVMRTPRSAAGTPQVSPPMGNGFLSGNANNPLLIDVTASGPVDGWIAGVEE